MKYQPAPSVAHVVLKTEMEAYESMRPKLESMYANEWAVVRGSELIGVYPEFSDAAREARKRFGRGPYLIRQVAPTNWQDHIKRHWQSHADS